MTRPIDQIAPNERVIWRSAKRLVKRRGPEARSLAINASHALAFEGDENGARSWRKTAQAVEWLLANPKGMDLIDAGF
ncbi:MAG: hypothetical protein FJX60_23205 [Alphaproteobacteria bacterium]|nr:hypothetical protein [Alphaproteobacteria bacterium]